MKGMGEYNLFDLYKNGVLAFERIKGDVKETYTFTYDGENINRFLVIAKNGKCYYDNKESGDKELYLISEKPEFKRCEPIFDYRDLF